LWMARRQLLLHSLNVQDDESLILAATRGINLSICHAENGA
jgi:hypothetical protein